MANIGKSETASVIVEMPRAQRGVIFEDLPLDKQALSPKSIKAATLQFECRHIQIQGVHVGGEWYQSPALQALRLESSGALFNVSTERAPYFVTVFDPVDLSFLHVPNVKYGRGELIDVEPTLIPRPNRSEYVRSGPGARSDPLALTLALEAIARFALVPLTVRYWRYRHECSRADIKRMSYSTFSRLARSLADNAPLAPWMSVNGREISLSFEMTYRRKVQLVTLDVRFSPSGDIESTTFSKTPKKPRGAFEF